MAKKPSKQTKAEADVKDTASPSGFAHSFPNRSRGEADILPVARRLGKLMSASLKATFQPLAEEALSVTCEDARIAEHSEWLEELPETTALAFYQLPPMKGRMAVRMPHELIAALVDAFFGGSIARGKPRKAGFSSSDTRLMHRVAQNLTPQIGMAWGQLGPFRCLAAGVTDDLEDVRLAHSPDAPLMVQPFTFSYPGKVSFTVDCIYSVEMIQSAREFFTSARPEETSPADPAWREAMGLAVAEAFLPVRSVLARPSMTMNQLANLKPGDLIPIAHARNLQLLVGDRPFARGTIGEQNGLAAFRIEHFEQGKSQ